MAICWLLVWTGIRLPLLEIGLRTKEIRRLAAETGLKGISAFLGWNSNRPTNRAGIPSQRWGY